MLLKKRKSRHKIYKHLLYIIKEAGFYGVSELQRKAVPAIMKRKKVIITAGEQRGKTSLLYLPEIISNDFRRFSIIITPDKDTAERIIKQYKRVTATLHNIPEIMRPGKNDIQLSSAYKKHILVCSSKEFIDITRLNRINLRRISKIYFTDNKQGKISHSYMKDIEFILAKKKNKTRTAFLFKFIDQEIIKSIRHFLRTIRVFDASKNMFHQHMIYKAFVKGEKSKRESLYYIINTYGNSANIYTSSPEIVQQAIADKFSQDYALNHNYFLPEDLCKIPGSDNLNINVIFDFKPASDFLTAVDFSKSAGPFFIIYTAEETDTLNIFKEKKNIQMKKLKATDVKLIERNIEDILKIVQEEADPDLMNEYKKIIKKKVRWHLRGYFSAFLLMNANQKNFKTRNPNTRNRRDKFDKNKNSSGSERNKKNQEPVKEKGLTTLFVSIGKNRKVFPKDLIKLFAKTLDIPTTTIGNAKIFDSYSFIDIPDQYAQKAIDQLNGNEFRKTKITVNYSKSK